MATWDVNWWPWGGVTVCFNEDELKELFAADDTAAGVDVLLALSVAPLPVQTAGILIAAWLQTEKGVAEAVDQGAGVCFFLPWLALALSQWWALIPSARHAASGQQHVNFVDARGHVCELVWKDGSGWGFTDLTGSASDDQPATAAPGSALDGYATPWNSQQHVNFVDARGHVCELVWKDGSGWGFTDLTGSASDDQPATAAPGSALDGYATPWNSQQHVNFVDARGHVCELVWKDGSGWGFTDLTGSASHDQPATAAPGSALDGYATPWNSQQHVNFVDARGHVCELVWKDGSGWGFTDLTGSASHDQPATAAPGSALDGYATPWNSQQHVNFVDARGHVCELVWKDGSGWGFTDLTGSASHDQPATAAPGSALDGYATPWNSQQHVNFVDARGHVCELVWKDGSGWGFTDLTGSASHDQPATAAPGSALDGYATPWNSQQHVNFVDARGHVCELVWKDGSGWGFTDLTGSASHDQPATAAPGSALDGYATG